MSQNKFFCESCDKPNTEVFLEEHIGTTYCKECSNSSTTACDVCFLYLPVKELLHRDGAVLCPECSETSAKCSNCGVLNICEKIDNLPYCEDCAENVSRCDGCHKPTMEEMKWIETNEEYLCAECFKVFLKKFLPKKCAPGYLGDRCFAVELEYNEVYSDNSNWDRIEDGSLDCEDGEFLSGPIRGVDAIKNIKENCKKIKGEITKNCGFHIHIDFTQDDVEAAKRFLACSVVLEDFVFSVIPKSRDRNTYCQRFTKEEKDKLLSSLFVESLKKLVYGYEDTCTQDKYHHKRYQWINMHSYFFRGTVEIRAHNGTGSPNKVLRWAELWTKLADWSAKQTSGFIISNIQNNKNFESYILNSIGLRDSTKEYFKERQKLFSR
jgi:hypothetical protein